ncbi:hypothetical protein ACYULU_15890 [Breznakiellaceae bacterium SP9]
MEKKFLGFVPAVIMLLLAGQVFGQSRKDIDDFFRDYEAWIVEWENLAKKSKVTEADMEKLQKKLETLKLEERAKLETTTAWQKKDSAKTVELETRVRAAMLTIVQKMEGEYYQ